MLFVFVTLFNLQGAHRSSRRVFIVALGFSFVKSFFQVFSNFFEPFHSPVVRGYCMSLSQATCLFYHSSFRLSRTFFKFFKTFWSSFSRNFAVSRAAPVSSSTRLPHSIPFVKHFFRAFSNSFVLTGLGGAPRWSACIYYQNIPPLSTPFFKFFIFSSSTSGGHSSAKISLAERHLLCYSLLHII